VVEPKGERRHITVMFCDLVGSTSISAALDAEDGRDLVGAYLNAAERCANRDRRYRRLESAP
jgi:class 3 adenylate cyclase